MQRLKIKPNHVFSAIFLLLIYVTMVISMILSVNGFEGTEVKSSLNKPTTNKFFNGYSEFINSISEYDKFFKKNFFLRNELFKINHFIKSDLFNTDQLPDKVVKGNHDFFFLGDDFGSVILETKGIINFSKSETDNLQRNILKTQLWLDSLNIKYYIAIAPEKATVYADYLKITKSSKPTKLEQLQSVCKDKVSCIDLKSDYKNYHDQLLFLKTDTHWNDLGALIGYQYLMSQIREDFKTSHFPVLTIQDFEKKSTISKQQDLTRMLLMEQEEEIVLFNQISNQNSKQVKGELPIPSEYFREEDNYELRYKSDVNKIKVLVFRDSFSSNLVKYLKESFGECVVIWHYNIDESIVLSEKPDIIIHEIVERNIDTFITGKL